MRLPVLSWVICVLALVGLVAWLGSPRSPENGRALIGGAFTLTDSTGATVTEMDFRGKYMLVYFGFTHCPDICPTGLLRIANALERLDEKASDIVPLFITLDPERDTPEVVGAYVKHFSPQLVGLTGTPEQIKQVADAYKVFYSKVEDKDSAMGYMIDHSGFIYLMGPDGQYITHFSHETSEQALAKGIAEKVRP